MINNLAERFETYATFRDVSIKEANSNDDIGQFAELGHFFGGCQSYEGSESGAWKYRL